MSYTIADMNPTQSVLQLERKIETLCRKLLELGPLHPGSASRQYQVCGKPGCRCMHPKAPQRHGPYYKLAYVHRGKPVCRFVRAHCVAEVQKRLANHKAFRAIIDEIISLSIQRGQIDLFGPPSTSNIRNQGRPSHRGTTERRSPKSKPS